MSATETVLARTTVLIDFDAVVAETDPTARLVHQLGGPDGLLLERAYDLGLVGSREFTLDAWDLLEPDEERWRAAADVGCDPGFAPLVGALRAGGAEVVVVSDGLGFYAADACGGLDVELLHNDVDFAGRRLALRHEDRCCPCATCGVCKQATLKDARRRGRRTVLVGARLHDRKAALLADLVVARGALARWCAAAGVHHVAFDDLAGVGRTLLG